jgi:hypothetical protein
MDKIKIELLETLVFKKGCYKDTLDGIMSYTEFDAIIKEASNIVGNAFNKKRKSDQIEYPRFMVLMAYFSIILTIAYGIMLYIASGMDDSKNQLLIGVSVICISVVFIITFVLALYNFKKKPPRFMTLEEIIRSDLAKYFLSVNQRYHYRVEFIYIENSIECIIHRHEEEYSKLLFDN